MRLGDTDGNRRGANGAHGPFFRRHQHTDVGDGLTYREAFTTSGAQAVVAHLANNRGLRLDQDAVREAERSSALHDVATEAGRRAVGRFRCGGVRLGRGNRLTGRRATWSAEGDGWGSSGTDRWRYHRGHQVHRNPPARRGTESGQAAPVRLDITPVHGPLSRWWPLECRQVRRTPEEALFHRLLQPVGWHAGRQAVGRAFSRRRGHISTGTSISPTSTWRGRSITCTACQMVTAATRCIGRFAKR